MKFTLLEFIIIIVAILIIISIIHIAIYNKIQYYKIRINESEANLDEDLRKRYDIILRAFNVIKTNISGFDDEVKSFEGLDKKNMSNFEMDRRLQKTTILIKDIIDDNSLLDDNRSFKEIMNDLRKNEERIEAAKGFYNKNTTKLNAYIKKFPSNIVARLHNIKVANYFDGKNMEDDIFDDFKL